MVVDEGAKKGSLVCLVSKGLVLIGKNLSDLVHGVSKVPYVLDSKVERVVKC